MLPAWKEWWQVIDQIADTVVASMADPESAPAGVARTDLDAYILKPFGLYAKHDRLLFKANEPFLGALQKIESQFPHIVERARRILKHTATLPVPVDVSDSKAREKGAADPDTNFSQEMFVRCCCGLVRIDKTTSAAGLLCISPEEYSFLYQWLYGIPDAPLPESETRPNTSTNLNKDDQTSVYSDILSIARAKPEGHVVTLAEELCKVVCAYQPTNDAIGRISELLPGLLEAFAVNLGGNMFPPMHRSVMMFILSYRGHIAKAFKDKICDKYPINEESHSSDEMSLDEQSKNAETDDRTSNDISYEAPSEQRDDISDSRQEYPEVEEEANSLPGLQEYMKLIKSAPAYNTLLASIRREFVFAQPEPNHMGDIRRTILTSVPVCSTSSLILDLEIYIMQYLLRLDPLTFVTGQEYASPADVAIGNAITLTGSVTTAQVATCAEYLNETWPWTGPFVLQLVKDQARCTNLRPLKVTLPDGTILSSNRLDGNQIDGASLLFTVTGSANRITEIGEQLAWLVAATHSSPDGHGVASCRPFLKKRCLNHRTAWEIGATLDEKQINPVPLHGQCWHNLFRNPVVVEGYPIPRRPAGTPGIEIPLRMMAELIQTSWVNPFAGRLVIKGFSQMLVPTEIRGDIIMWHLLQSKEGERISYSDCMAFPQVEILLSNLENFRHVLGWCSEMEFCAGSRDACYEAKSAGLPKASGDCLLANASLREGQLLVGGHPFVIGKKDSGNRSSRDYYSRKLAWVSEKFVVLWDEKDKRGWLVNGASALLHIVMTSLEQLSPAFKSICLFDPASIQEGKHPHQPDSATEVLLNTNNRQLRIYREDDGPPRFQDQVEICYNMLEKMIEYQLIVLERVRNSRIIVPRAHLEGWDFRHLAQGFDPIYPRLAVLDTNGKSWVDFTRSIHAVTLFGRGFGEIIRPTGACSAWATLPCGKYYLAACAADLQKIMDGHGGQYSTPLRLTDDDIWYIPDKSTGQCLCKDKTDATHSDLAQILLPSDMCKNLSLNPSGCYQTDRGAFIFGFNEIHQWFWNDTGNPFRKMAGESSDLLLNPGISYMSDSSVFRESLGIEEVRDASYLRLVPQQMSSDNYTVGIICALTIELKAVGALFDSTHAYVPSPDHDPNDYVFGSICGHNVVASCLPDGDYGTTSAALAAGHMCRSFNGVEFYLLVGVGGGAPHTNKQDIRLGDVVVSTPKGSKTGGIPYDTVKTLQGGVHIINGYLSPPPYRLRSVLRVLLKSDPNPPKAPLQPYLGQIAQSVDGCGYPGQENDQLFDSDYSHLGEAETCDSCDPQKCIQRTLRPSTQPRIHYGLIASGNQVMKDSKTRDRLGEEQDILCFEMEAAGIMNTVPALVIRGICDYSDSHKNKGWQKYAAATAAAFMKLLLSNVPVSNDRGQQQQAPMFSE